MTIATATKVEKFGDLLEGNAGQETYHNLSFPAWDTSLSQEFIAAIMAARGFLLHHEVERDETGRKTRDEWFAGHPAWVADYHRGGGIWGYFEDSPSPATIWRESCAILGLEDKWGPKIPARHIGPCFYCCAAQKGCCSNKFWDGSWIPGRACLNPGYERWDQDLESAEEFLFRMAMVRLAVWEDGRQAEVEA